MTQMTFDEILTEPPAEEGDDSVNTPDEVEIPEDDDFEDVPEDDEDEADA